MSKTYHKVNEVLEDHGIDSSNTPALGKLIYEICETMGYQVPQFKDNRNTLYRLRGYKVADRLKQHREKTGGEIYASVIYLKDMPLQDEKTVKLAKRLQDKVIPRDSPSRTKLETDTNRNAQVHVHFLFSATNPPPEKVTISKKDYIVSTVKIGSNDAYKDRTYNEQLATYVSYLYKPGITAGGTWHTRLNARYSAYLEWFVQQKELAKLTINQRKKIKGVRLSWNKNIKQK